ncbi:MAG: hypothetical protein V7720_11045 [Halioglobus sp.]
MKTGKTLRGSTSLALDAAHGVTTIVEEMYRNIAATPFPLGDAPEGRARGIAGLVHESIRRVIGTTKSTTDWLLERIAPELDRTLPPGPRRETIISALNGVCGDHLEKSKNALAIPMQFRVLLPVATPPAGIPGLESPLRDPSIEQEKPAPTPLEAQKPRVEIYPQATALTDASFAPTGRLLILAHGLSMSDHEWTSNEHNHPEAIAQDSDFTPIYVLYNSGRNISTNGREFCEQIIGLLETWPVPVTSISFIGFSMGGLLTRAAMHIAKQEGHSWLSKVDKAVYVGTPHHGAVMERGGYWIHKALTFSPYTAPLSAIARIRSAGITDLRHGNVQDEDWGNHDEHEDNIDARQPTPLPAGIKHYAIAATMSKRSGERIGKLLGDGLVHPSSATGRHSNPDLHLSFPEEHTKVFYDLGHLGMLRDSRVTGQLKEWLID